MVETATFVVLRLLRSVHQTKFFDQKLQYNMNWQPEADQISKPVDIFFRNQTSVDNV